MGWTPAQVDACFMWDFLASYEGWKQFNAAPKGPTAPTDADFEAAVLADMGATIH